MALVNFSQGKSTRGTLNWLTLLTIGFLLATTAAILSSSQLGATGLMLLGGSDTPNVMSCVAVSWRVVGLMSPSAVSAAVSLGA